MNKPYLFLFLIGCQFTTLAQSHSTPASVWHDPITMESKPGKTAVSESEPGVRRYTGSVKLQHQGTVIFCDQATHQLTANSVNATGHVLLVQGDSITVKSDSLFYDGVNRQVTLVGHVLFQDEKRVLTSTRIEYDLLSGIARYAGKGRLVNGRTILTHSEGSYSTRTGQAITSPPPNAALTLATTRADAPEQELASITVPMQAVSAVITPDYPSAASPKIRRPAGQQSVATRLARPTQPSHVPAVLTASAAQLTTPPYPVAPATSLPADTSRIISKSESKESAVSYMKRVRSSRQSPRSKPQPISRSTADESDLERLLNRKKQVY